MKTNTEMETLGGFPCLPALRPRRAKPSFATAFRKIWNAGLVLAVLAMPALALAAEAGAEREIPRLGLSPGDPQVRSATPSVPFGIQPAESKKANVLDFHGYMLMPAHLGLHERDPLSDAQSGTVLHSPPLMAQNLRSFEYTGVVPSPWLQMNFLYGNSSVYATAILVGTSAMDGSSYYNPVEQFGVNDAFITANLTKTFGFPFLLHVGAFTGRYGAMGAWDAGRYGTPLIARTNTIGETIVAGYKLGEVFFVLEQGLGGRRPGWSAPGGTTTRMPTWARPSSTRCTSGLPTRGCCASGFTT